MSTSSNKLDAVLHILKTSTQKLNSQQKSHWLSALRSGDYKQTRIFLKSLDNKYCCLGVLCEINNLQCVEKDATNYFVTVPQEKIHWSLDERDTKSAWMLPSNFAKTINVSSELQLALSTLNDSGYTFAQIADLIEAHL